MAAVQQVQDRSGGLLDRAAGDVDHRPALTFIETPRPDDFVADGVAVHNSIEQDADVVILLHKDKEREGEADVLVVKHRNGPTKDLVLGFQGHYARFSNMAASGGF